MVNIVESTKQSIQYYDKMNKPGGESEEPNWKEDQSKVTDFIKR